MTELLSPHVTAPADAGVGLDRPTRVIQTHVSVLLFLVIAGALAYQSVPKEAEPDVAIPIMYVSLVYQGIYSDWSIPALALKGD